MDKQLTVLITRPQPGADAFAAMLPEVRTVISPVMAIEPLQAALGAPDIVVITSAHAIAALSGLTGRPLCYAVGEATSEKARAAGLNAVMAGETADQVADRMIADRPQGQILYARGRHVAFEMAGTLRDAGLLVSEAVVYEQVTVPLTPEAQDRLTGPETLVLPLFSARSAQVFFDACPTQAQLHVIAISQSVADCVPEAHQNTLTIVPNPDAPSMARAVINAATHGNRLEQGKSAQ